MSCWRRLAQPLTWALSGLGRGRGGRRGLGGDVAARLVATERWRKRQRPSQQLLAGSLRP